MESEQNVRPELWETQIDTERVVLTILGFVFFLVLFLFCVWCLPRKVRAAKARIAPAPAKVELQPA